MEVTFSNNANVIDAFLHTMHDKEPIYKVDSTFGILGRKHTFLRDVNPISSPESKLYATHNSHPRKDTRKNGGQGSAGVKKDPVTVGAIHWKERMIEVQGVKKKLDEVKRKKGFLNKSRYWKWAEDRKEYEVRHDGDKKWVVTFSTPIQTKSNVKSKTEKDRDTDKDNESKPTNIRSPSRSPGDSRSHSRSLSSSRSLSASEAEPGSEFSPPSGQAATFRVPYRPHVFRKSKSDPNTCTLSISRDALKEDEIFMILLMIYSETRRQEGMLVSSHIL
ncbi:hypothetical protein D9758_019010 [Tetrapyrgos nigripes]|uniref:Uncharacterized protein n=1 Tax=Tetrapyrgos nigripes TaxID=182062 RepID=A0A8H5B1H7_9AGAR|nr:hypothetical protein D9758_019010 [Tetrapyrgos nigripes]